MVFAIALTFIVALMALGLTDSGPSEVLRGWGDGLSSLLEFIAQIAIVLVLGYTLAHTGPVARMLNSIANIPRNPAAAYAFVTVIGGLASLISWGLGLIVGGIIALQVGRSAKRRGIRIHYPLLVASAYSGYIVWHMGYSGSGPLAAATPGSFYEEYGGLVPVVETTFAWWNLIAIVVLLSDVAFTNTLLRPRGDDPIVELKEELVEEETNGRNDGTSDESSSGDDSSGGGSSGGTPSPADRADGSRILTLALGGALLGYLVLYFAQEGFALTLDIVNWSFLAAILLLVTSTKELGALVADAGRTVGQILLQYPLYAGILGIMTASGLVEVFSNFFVNISTPGTLSVWAMISGGIVNMFIPSGGGQFAVQAPIFADAAQQLGVEQSVAIMGIAYGDQWTNMIQPFWTVPILAIAGLSVRDIMGYTTVILFISGAIMATTLLLVGAG
jgi:short-chain fatty acids transporter